MLPTFPCVAKVFNCAVIFDIVDPGHFGEDPDHAWDS
jgi:hypothetical protein